MSESSAILMSIINQLDDVIDQIRKEIEPIEVQPPDVSDDELAKAMRPIHGLADLHPSHKKTYSDRTLKSDQVSMFQYNIYGVQYWPLLDKLCVLRSRVTQYLIECQK